MKTPINMIFGTLTLVGFSLITAVVRAGGWDNLRLNHFHLTQHFGDQTRELADIRSQNIDIQNNSRIDLEELLNGGPPKDGIPSIDNPKFDTAATTPFDPEQATIGVVVNGEAKAYPVGILNWHEIVNDRIGGVNVAISYCPLCDTIVAFDRGDTTFGVSGKLYQSCLVMYDRADDTLYAQPWGLGIVGANVNRSLDRIRAVKTTLGAWLEKYPDSRILSAETGYNRDYQRYPYGSYSRDRNLIFPVRHQDQLDLHPKAAISYIWKNDGDTPHNQFSGESVQFVHSEIQKLGERTIRFDGEDIRAVWDEQLQTVIVQDAGGTTIPSSHAFAFVYPAFMETPATTGETESIRRQ
ncbi:MAG: DUF3179 domain-containing protein [Limnospira sp.]